MTFPAHIKQKVLNKQAGLCGHPKCNDNIHSIHHIISNTVTNRKIYGKRIQLEENAVGLCAVHHTNVSWLKEKKQSLIKKWENNHSKIK